MLGRALPTVLLAGLLAAAGASAAGLPVGSSTMGAAIALLVPCQVDDLVLRYGANSTGQVTTATVSGIDPACAGGTIRVTLVSGSTVVGAASANLPEGSFSGQVSLSISPPPASSLISAAHVALDGR